MNPPVFLLACGPRTGSTWLQRCLIKNGVMVWGEKILIGFLHLMEHEYVRRAMEQGLDWNVKHMISQPVGQWDEMWAAVMNPPMRHWDLKAFCDSYYGSGVETMGFDGWGVKETMWHQGWDDRLREAYPDCKILYLTRNFLDAYHSRFGASYSPPQWGAPELDWALPDDYNATEYDRKVLDHQLFCRRWCNLTATANAKQDRPNTRLVRYEDLIAEPQVLREALVWAGCDTTEASMSKIGASPYVRLCAPDTLIIGCYLDEINRVSEKLGYEEITL